MMDGRARQLKEGHRKNNILIFGLEERKYEGYLNSQGVVMNFLMEKMKLEILNGSIDYVRRLERRKWERSIIVQFTPFSVKMEVLTNTKILVCSKVGVD
jgi:hypothetical protein